MNYTALILTILGIVAAYFILCLIGTPLVRYTQIKDKWYSLTYFFGGVVTATLVVGLFIIISSIYVWISSFV